MTKLILNRAWSDNEDRIIRRMLAAGEALPAIAVALSRPKTVVQCRITYLRTVGELPTRNTAFPKPKQEAFRL